MPSAIESFLSTVGVTDLLDILLTSVGIYYTLILIRGTRAVQILLGILVLVMLLGVATLLHLYLLRSILQVIVLGAAVTIPILFQPELRRALEQIGRGDLFRMAGEAEPSRVAGRAISTIAQTAFALARNRYGGLIVIEQQTGLREFAETGTILESRLCAELLIAIFVPRSPLHDGAVIVRDMTVEAAGCLLPLADQPLAPRRLGTRHRAALGLSEQTDAVVVVISEESSAITVAQRGTLTAPVEQEEELVRLLLSVTRKPRTERPRGDDLVSHLRARLMPRRETDQGELRADNTQKLRT
jgi:diadenylate cyclase